MPSPLMAFGATPYLLVVAVLLGGMGGYKLKDVACRSEMTEFKADLQSKKDDQEELTRKVEAAGIANREGSTQRLDTQDATRQAEVKDVQQETIRYVTRYRDAACPEPGSTRSNEWVCLYNRSLGLPCGLPKT